MELKLLDGIKTKLDLCGETAEKAGEILDKCSGLSLTPEAATGGAVYIACVLLGDRRSQREVALASGVAEATIRRSHKKIASNLDVEITA